MADRVFIKAKRKIETPSVTVLQPDKSEEVKERVEFLKPPTNNAFFLRYGYIGHFLADNLCMLSLDVVGEIAKYAQEFRLIRTLGNRDPHLSAAHRIVIDNNGNIYAIEDNQQLCRYDAQGQNRTVFFDRQVLSFLINTSTNQLFVLTYMKGSTTPQEVVVFNPDLIIVARTSVFAAGKYNSYHDITLDTTGTVILQSNIRVPSHHLKGFVSTTPKKLQNTEKIKSGFEYVSLLRLQTHFLQGSLEHKKGHRGCSCYSCFLNERNQEHDLDAFISVNVDEEHMHLHQYPYLNRHAFAMHPVEKSIYVSTYGQHVAKVYVI